MENINGFKVVVNNHMYNENEAIKIGRTLHVSQSLFDELFPTKKWYQRLWNYIKSLINK